MLFRCGTPPFQFFVQTDTENFVRGEEVVDTLFHPRTPGLCGQFSPDDAGDAEPRTQQHPARLAPSGGGRAPGQAPEDGAPHVRYINYVERTKYNHDKNIKRHETDITSFGCRNG